MTQNLKSIRVRYCEFYFPAVHIWYLLRILKLCICHVQYLYQLEGFRTFWCTSLYRRQSRHWRSIFACGWLPVYQFKEKSRSAYQHWVWIIIHSFVSILYSRNRWLPYGSLPEALNFRSLKQQPIYYTYWWFHCRVREGEDYELLHPLVILIDFRSFLSSHRKVTQLCKTLSSIIFSPISHGHIATIIALLVAITSFF